MNIRGKNKDIIDIRLGHESESFGTGWLMCHNDTPVDIGYVLNAYEDGFYQGIEFLANYLKEYDITIEIFDKPVSTTDKEDWYSGDVINK